MKTLYKQVRAGVNKASTLEEWKERVKKVWPSADFRKHEGDAVKAFYRITHNELVQVGLYLLKEKKGNVMSREEFKVWVKLNQHRWTSRK